MGFTDWRFIQGKLNPIRDLIKNQRSYFGGFFTVENTNARVTQDIVSLVPVENYRDIRMCNIFNSESPMFSLPKSTNGNKVVLQYSKRSDLQNRDLQKTRFTRFVN